VIRDEFLSQSTETKPEATELAESSASSDWASVGSVSRPDLSKPLGNANLRSSPLIGISDDKRLSAF